MRKKASAPEQVSGSDTAEKRPAKPPRRSIFDDKVVRTMRFVAFGLVIFYLAVIVTALFLGILGNNAPKTAAERDMTIYRQKVEGGSQSERDWAVYAQALTDAGQYGRAQSVIDQAREAGYLDPRIHSLALAQVRLYYAEGKWEEAIEAADAGMAALRTQRDEDVKTYQESGKISPMVSQGLGDNYYRMLLIKATALEELEKDTDALAALDEYLAERATAADVLEWRGDVHLRLGNRDLAAADYRAAKRFSPNSTELDGKLEQLGVTE